MSEETGLKAYIDSRRAMVNEALQGFIHDRYQGSLEEMAAYAITGGKRLRGVMAVLVCEALGGTAQRALFAACAVELAHSSSLVSDDVMDNDQSRRGLPSFWKRFGFGMASLFPHVVVPHAIQFTGVYGPRALGTVVTAWADVTRGQVMDYPRARGLLPVRSQDYGMVCGLKTAPLFSAAAELGVRASGKEWFLGMAKQYGQNTGIAFQVYDDACDLLQVVGQPWESASRGPLPVSLQALRMAVGGETLVREEDVLRTLELAGQYLEKAEQAARAFPDGQLRAHLVEFPRSCCQAQLEEAGGAEAVKAYGRT